MEQAGQPDLCLDFFLPGCVLCTVSKQAQFKVCQLCHFCNKEQKIGSGWNRSNNQSFGITLPAAQTELCPKPNLPSPLKHMLPPVLKKPLQCVADAMAQLTQILFTTHSHLLVSTIKSKKAKKSISQSLSLLVVIMQALLANNM